MPSRVVAKTEIPEWRKALLKNGSLRQNIVREKKEGTALICLIYWLHTECEESVKSREIDNEAG